MIKVYRSDNSVVVTSVDLMGRRIPVRFTAELGYNPFQRGSYYKTSSENVQRALEESGNFNSLYYLDEEETAKLNAEEMQPEVEKVEKKKLTVVQVSSLADAKAWLQDNKGWNPKTRVSSKRLVEAAEEYGVKFEGLEI